MAEDLGTGELTVQLNEQQAVAAIDRLAAQLVSKMNRASREAGIKITQNLTDAFNRVDPAITALGRRMVRELGAAAREAGREITTALREAASDASPLTVQVDADTRLARAEIADLDGRDITVNVDVDAGTAEAAIDALARDRRSNVRVDVDRSALATARKAIEGLGSALGGLTRASGAALGIASIGIAAAGTAQSVAALGAALAPAAGAIAALPAIALGAGAAIGTLKLALGTFGDAVKGALTGDTKKFNKALEQLGPSAQSVAHEVEALKPAFDELRNAVQGAFFDRIQGQITETAAALGGGFKDALVSISSRFGIAASEALKFLASTDGVARSLQVVRGTSDALGSLPAVTAQVTKGFLDIAGAVSEAFGTRLSNAIGSVGQSLGSFLTRAAEGGQAVAWVEGALTVFKQLGTIIGNVGGIISGVFNAANSVGGGLLNNLIAITGQLSQFVNSAKGAEALSKVFQAVSSIAANLGPIIAQIAIQLGTIAPQLTPILNTLGPAIVNALKAVGPAIAALGPGVQALATGLANAVSSIADSGALTSLTAAISNVAKAIAPILPVAAQLAITLGQALTPIVNALAPVLGAAAIAIGSMVTAIQPLIITAGLLIAQLGPILLPIVQAIGVVFQQLTPVLQAVADVLLATLSPILAQLPALLAPILTAFTTLISAILPVATQLLAALSPAIAQVTASFVQVAVALAPVLTQLAQLAAQILSQLSPLLPPLIALVGKLASILASQLAGVINNVVLPALRLISSVLSGDLSGAFEAFKDLALGVGKQLLDFFVKLPFEVLKALGSLASALIPLGEDLIRGLIIGVNNMVGALLNSVKNVIGGAINGAKKLLDSHSPSRVFIRIGRDVGRGMVIGLDGQAAAVARSATRLAAASIAPFNGLSASGVAVGGFSGVGAAAVAPRSSQTLAGATGGAVAFPGAQRAGTTINVSISEVGDAQTTAQRVINRLVTAGVGL